MSNHRKPFKQIITEAVLAELPSDSVFHNRTLEEIMFTWWMTGRQSSLRLTDVGMMAFESANIEHYDFDFKIRTDVTHHAFLLELNKKINCPFYLGVIKGDKKKPCPYIRLYDSKIAMWAGLYGDFLEYLDATKTIR